MNVVVLTSVVAYMILLGLSLWMVDYCERETRETLARYL